MERSIEEIGKTIRSEKQAIKEHNRIINCLQKEIKEREKINMDKIIETIPLSDPSGKIVAMIFNFESGLQIITPSKTIYVKRWK